MEANRPAPVDLSQFHTGDSHKKIVTTIGAPASNLKENEQSCDVYKLYTDGPSANGSGAIAFGEAAADVVTLGLAEVIFTPVEAGTKSVPHTVTFCYTNDKLVSLQQSTVASQ
jgi:hypothetical protein